MKSRLFSQRMSRRALVALIAHLVSFVGVYWLAFALRFADFRIPAEEWQTFFVTLTAVLCVKSIVFYAGGHCHRSWHYVSFSDLAALLRSATYSSLIIATLDYLTAKN